MLRKFFVLALLFHFGEFRNIKQVFTYLTNSGSHVIQYTQAIHLNGPLPLPPSPPSYGSVIQTQYNQFQPPIDKPNTAERFNINENQPNPNQVLSPTSADAFFVPNVNNEQQQNQQPTTYRPQVYQQSQTNFAQAPINTNLHFKKENYDTTTLRSQVSFDRTSMVGSEEFSQRPVQRPSSDSFVNENKYKQDEASSTYPNGNTGISRDQTQPIKQVLQHMPDENAIIIPNMPSNIVEIVFPPTLSYDDDASTTTRASIFDSMRRRSTSTTERYSNQ